MEGEGSRKDIYCLVLLGVLYLPSCRNEHRDLPCQYIDTAAVEANLWCCPDQLKREVRIYDAVNVFVVLVSVDINGQQRREERE